MLPTASGPTGHFRSPCTEERVPCRFPSGNGRPSAWMKLMIGRHHVGGSEMRREKHKMLTLIKPLLHLSRRGQQITILAATAVVISGVIAYANIPSANGVINGCYDQSTGGLRVIDFEAGQKCRLPGESALNWNQTGPQGPQGPEGPSGPAGVSAVAFVPPTLVNLDPFGGLTLVVSKTLPAGNWAIFSTVELGTYPTQSGGLVSSLCILRNGTTYIATASDRRWKETTPGFGTNTELTLPLNSVIALPQGGTISIACRLENAPNPYASVSMTMMQVGGVLS